MTFVLVLLLVLVLDCNHEEEDEDKYDDDYKDNGAFRLGHAERCDNLVTLAAGH